MPSPTPRFVSGNNYGGYLKYTDTNAPVGSELNIFTIAAENLAYFVDVAGAGLEPQTGGDVVVTESASKGGTAKVHRFPNDPEPYNRKNVARKIMKNRDVRHGAGLPGRRFTLQERPVNPGDETETRTFTYQGTTTALHALLVGNLKKDVRFINSNGAWEMINKPAENGG